MYSTMHVHTLHCHVMYVCPAFDIASCCCCCCCPHITFVNAHYACAKVMHIIIITTKILVHHHHHQDLCTPLSSSSTQTLSSRDLRHGCRKPEENEKEEEEGKGGESKGSEREERSCALRYTYTYTHTCILPACTHARAQHARAPANGMRTHNQTRHQHTQPLATYARASSCCTSLQPVSLDVLCRCRLSFSLPPSLSRSLARALSL
jgi:hypothetical protein